MVAPTKPGTAPLGIVKRSEEDFSEWISTEPGFLEGVCSFDDRPLKLERYQLAFLQTTARYRCVEKARQVGYSLLFSCESLARSHLRDTHNSIFVSYNLADAKEKIAYVGQMHEELPLEFQKKRVVDSKLELGFRSNKAHGRISRIISNPSKAPRGKKGDIYLDELAHCANDREIYKGSTALILRSNGQLTVCSSPLGRRGQFWEISRQELRPYPAFWRQKIPWWLCSELTNDTFAASKFAPGLDTESRVMRFGSTKIKLQFSSLDLEDFQQEFEVVYSDESSSFFPYDLILPCTDDEVQPVEDFASIEHKGGRLLAGFDVGRKKDLAVLVIFEEVENIMVLRCVRTYEKVAFQIMENDLNTLLTTLPIARLSIDGTGMGMQLAENLRLRFPQVVSENFTTQTKEVWCTDFKIRLQRQTIRLPRDRQIVSEIHSIKKRVTEAGRVIFSAEKTQKSHADRFWAMALAVRAERGELRTPIDIGARVVGEHAMERPAPAADLPEAAIAIALQRALNAAKKKLAGNTTFLALNPDTKLIPVRILPFSAERHALEALDSTIKQLPGMHMLTTYTPDAQGFIGAISTDPGFLRFSCEQQGYAQLVIID